MRWTILVGVKDSRAPEPGLGPILLGISLLALGLGCTGPPGAPPPDAGHARATGGAAAASSALRPLGAEGPAPIPANIMPEQRIQTGDDVERTADGLVRVHAPEARGAVYVKPPRPHLQRYRAMMVEPASITYRESGGRFRESVQNLLEEGFRKDLLAAIRRGPAWESVDVPGPDVLLVPLRDRRCRRRARPGRARLDRELRGRFGGRARGIRAFGLAYARAPLSLCGAKVAALGRLLRGRRGSKTPLADLLAIRAGRWSRPSQPLCRDSRDRAAGERRSVALISRPGAGRRQRVQRGRNRRMPGREG